MAANADVSTDAKEQLFTLPDGRTLAYSANGNASSSTIVLYLHGFFTVGDVSSSSAILHKNVHYISPTLPGWGNSSPIPAGATYASILAADMTALLKHLHPDDANLKLYVGGGSFGTAPAQMLYGAPFDVFPPGKYLKGLLLMGAITPFRHHKEYTKSLTLPNYIMVGPPGRNLPFNIIPRLAMVAMKGKLESQDTAEAFLQKFLFDDMGEEERVAYARWREENNLGEGQLLKDMAAKTVQSVANSWDGFLRGTEILHSDWGFRPDTLDDEHAKRPILIVTGSMDTSSPVSMAEWLVANYKNARLRVVVGSHVAPMFYSNEIWNEFLEHEG